jgi:hypothetical protein
MRSCCALTDNSAINQVCQCIWAGAADNHCCCCCCLQDEHDGKVRAISLSLRQLLALASQRCALLLRKVDMRGSCAEEQQLLELLAQMWMGNPLKLTQFRKVLIFDKEAQQQ